jgi:hypothetical protein
MYKFIIKMAGIRLEDVFVKASTLNSVSGKRKLIGFNE